MIDKKYVGYVFCGAMLVIIAAAGIIYYRRMKKSYFVPNPNWTYGGPGSTIDSASTPITSVLDISDGIMPSLQKCQSQVENGGLLVPDDVTGIGFDGFDTCSFYTADDVKLSQIFDRTVSAMVR